MNPLTIEDVTSDEQGILPSQLSALLESYEGKAEKPKVCSRCFRVYNNEQVLYTIPTACNPTGASTPLDRKKEIYALAQKHNVLIVEDDPYYYLQFQSGEERTPSYFSMDTDHRVLRFDSFSKILSSGIRVGFVTGPKPLIERITLHSQATVLHPGGLSQMVAILLFRQWGLDGFLKHVQTVCSFYRHRRDLMIRLAETYLKGLAVWHPPTAGMFLWMQLVGIQDTRALIQEKAIEKKVILLPGAEFQANGGPSSFVRAAFSTATEQQMEEAFKRLAELLQQSKE